MTINNIFLVKYRTIRILYIGEIYRDLHIFIRINIPTLLVVCKVTKFMMAVLLTQRKERNKFIDIKLSRER